MRLAVIGSRDFKDFDLLVKSIEEFCAEDPPTLIVSGGAKGADSLAERYAGERGIETQIFLPDWQKFGRSAGFRRNQDIVDSSDVCIAFWDGSSKGTLSSIEMAKKREIPLKIVRFDQ